METKFTKGWSVVLPIECGYDPIVLTSDGFDPTDVQVFGEQAIAHAHLIAASPDLYEALETAAKRFRQYESLHRAKRSEEGNLKADNNADLAEFCEAILARARGEQL